MDCKVTLAISSIDSAGLGVVGLDQWWHFKLEGNPDQLAKIRRPTGHPAIHADEKACVLPGVAGGADPEGRAPVEPPMASEFVEEQWFESGGTRAEMGLTFRHRWGCSEARIVQGTAPGLVRIHPSSREFKLGAKSRGGGSRLQSCAQFCNELIRESCSYGVKF